METLNFRFEHGQRKLAAPPHMVGVVGSGNLEVLIEPAQLGGACEIDVRTAANGFGETWRSVMADFHERWKLADAHISINDMGATPAVVSLRLDQAAETMTGGPP